MTVYEVPLMGGFTGRIEPVPVRTPGASYWQVTCPCPAGLDERVPMIGNRRPDPAYDLLRRHASAAHPGDPQPGGKLNVVMARETFAHVVDDVTGGGPVVWVGAWGFAGTASHLARFMLLAQATFGDEDTMMLAVIVEATDHPSSAGGRPGWRVYRFPGLDLY